MAGSSAGARERPGPGPVMVIGGAEDKMKDRVILSRFVKDAGGPDARIVVIATASSLGDAATEFYRNLFTAMGVERVTGLRPVTREDANEDAGVDAVADATGVFLTGGNQLRLSSVVGGTRLGRALIEAHERGAVVAGTSAGASALATHMMAFGASGATPKHRMAQMSAGLGVLRGMVIDQHFEQRTRLGRLLAAVAQSPSMIGIGLDEDTAAIVHADQTLEVIGRGAVTIVDGSSAVTDAFHTKGYRPMMVSGAILHSLPAGSRFDLERRALLPGAEPTVRPGGRSRRRVEQMARRMAAEGANSFSVEEPVREASE
jgi:cyanophycinase